MQWGTFSKNVNVTTIMFYVWWFNRTLSIYSMLQNFFFYFFLELFRTLLYSALNPWWLASSRILVFLVFGWVGIHRNLYQYTKVFQCDPAVVAWLAKASVFSHSVEDWPYNGGSNPAWGMYLYATIRNGYICNGISVLVMNRTTSMKSFLKCFVTA